MNANRVSIKAKE